MTPVVFIYRALKFKIHANDHPPPHVHVEGLGASVRVNLATLEFMDERTEFSKKSLLLILTEVTRRKDELLEEWMRFHEEN